MGPARAVDTSHACRGRWVLRKFRLLLVSAALNPQAISAVERANVKRTQLIERELLRKEKALTESGALMILRKKRRRSWDWALSNDYYPRSPTNHHPDQ